jgi:hypothetical protein
MGQNPGLCQAPFSNSKIANYIIENKTGFLLDNAVA